MKNELFERIPLKTLFDCLTLSASTSRPNDDFLGEVKIEKFFSLCEFQGKMKKCLRIIQRRNL